MKNSVFRPIVRHLTARNSSSQAFRRSNHPWQAKRAFHVSPSLAIVKPYLLADIGEGITECQIIQWFVEPGATVEQFDKICEVQSDKATVEITSRFDGVIKKLYYEADDMAKVGKPLVDIDIKSEISAEDEALTKAPSESTQEEDSRKEDAPKYPSAQPEKQRLNEAEQPSQPRPTSNGTNGKHASLATPAVRHLVRELNLTIEDIPGTGKDGRVLKEDVQRFSKASQETTPTQTTPSAGPTPTAIPLGEDQTQPLTPIQSQMFKTMTRSLTIPHFLYTDSIDFTSLLTLRHTLNSSRHPDDPKLSSLPFILKAVSLALTSFPLLNSHLDTSTSKPTLTQKASHNIGIAIDSSTGLIVPVIRNVQTHSIRSLAAEITRLSSLARTNKLSSADLQGATFTISNIGSIGGTAVAPVIVPPQVGILGVGRSRVVPAFGKNEELIRREECVFSWSADHRVVDGAYAARAAERVRVLLEDVGRMVVEMR